MTKTKLMQALHDAGHPITAEEILKRLTDEKKADVTAALNALMEEGRVKRTRKGCFALPEHTGLLYGRVQANAKGFGFFIPEAGGEDMFIPAEAMHGALHGDMVWVRKLSGNGGASDRVEVTSVAKRAFDRLTGVYDLDEFGGYVTPDDSRIPCDVQIIDNGGNKPIPGDKVVATISQYPTQSCGMTGKITEVLGRSGEKGVDMLSIIRRLQLPDEFAAEAVSEAEALNAPVKMADIKGRRDLRNTLTITIDGADAKDLDDAVSLSKLKNGRYRLGVHIADVSHYVVRGSALDKDAYERGTSVYFPDRVLPMLPTALSNGACSLNPNEDKLTLSCIMEIDNSGNAVQHEITESVIRSNYRMTYDDVNAIFAGDEVLRGKYAEILPMLEDMRELMGILHEKRVKRGSIDFDLAEAKITLDDKGVTDDVHVYERGESNRMIEEFMLAANETVAQHAVDANMPLMYRIHEAPTEERIQELNVFLGTLGFGIRGVDKLKPAAVQRVLEKAKGSKQESVVAQVTLRAMTKAKYSPECAGHFGLAAESYCHFTSPIRRYPDLTVHRIMKEMLHDELDEARTERWKTALPEASKHCSDREGVATEAERAADDLKKCEYMQAHLGEEHTGIITGVAQFGFFVQLPNTVEGMVRAGSMQDDYYICDEKNYRMVGRASKRQYRLGDEVQVTAVAANMETGKIEFMLTADAKHTQRPAYKAEKQTEHKGKRQTAKPRKATDAAKPRKAAEGAKPHRTAESAKPRTRHGKRTHRHAPKKVIE